MKCTQGLKEGHYGLCAHAACALQVDVRIAQEALEHDCLVAAKIVAEDIWKKKEIRYNTKHNYTINKCAPHACMHVHDQKPRQPQVPTPLPPACI